MSSTPISLSCATISLGSGQHEAGRISSPIVLVFVTGSFHEKKSMMISESGMLRRTCSLATAMIWV